MSENHPTEYFTVFEGTYSKACPVNRRPVIAAPQPPTSTKGKVAVILALLVLGATTAVALTASQQANVAGPNWQHSATFINLPGIVAFEDALY
jgi:hypothetical protein